MANVENKGFTQSSEPVLHFRYPITLSEARAAKKDLQRYFDLVTVYKQEVLDEEILDKAPPVHTLIKDYDEKYKRQQIIRYIGKLMPVVKEHMKFVGTSPKHTRSVDDKEETIDVINDFFQVTEKDQQRKLYNSIRLVVYKTMGLYEKLEKKSLIDMFHPVAWLSRLLNLPVNAMRRAGVNVETEKTNKMHYWVLQILMGVLLTALIVKLDAASALLTLLKGII